MKTIIFKMLVLLAVIFFTAACSSKRNDSTGNYTNESNKNQAGNAETWSRKDTATGGGTVYQGGNANANNSGQNNSSQQPGGTSSMNNRQNNSANNQNNVSMNIATADRNFAIEAYKGGKMEVKMANMAMERAHSVRVKDFAQMMVKDHTKANNELETILSRQNLMTMVEKENTDDNDMHGMKNKTGTDFDVSYMRAMVNDHIKDVDLFRKQSTQGQDPELKGFASKTLPVLKAHLDSARAVYGSLGSATSRR